MVQRVNTQQDSRANGLSDASTPYLGSAPDHSMTFDLKDITDVTVANVATSEVMAKESNGKQQRLLIACLMY
jgi:hypothetical protein